MSIFKMRQAQTYRNEETGGEGSSGGSGGTSIDLNNPDIQKVIQAKIDEEVKGLKSKNSEVIGKLKAAQEQMKQFEGLDVEKLKGLQKQLESNEELRLRGEGKVDELIERRVELLRKDKDAEIAARDSKLQEYENILKQKEENLRKLAVDSTIQQAYGLLDFEPSALDDVIRVARDVFIMDEHGDVVPRDAKGNIIFSKDGKSPITTKEWLELQAERKPYLRRPSKGGGAQGNKTGARAFSDLSSTGKIAEGLKQLGM